jgi:hypothetical protein
MLRSLSKLYIGNKTFSLKREAFHSPTFPLLLGGTEIKK